jgi:glutamyl-tRNA reductase
MVLGETQILGQVREAYELSSSLGAAGAQFHSLFQRAIARGQAGDGADATGRGPHERRERRGRLRRQIFDSFGDKTVLSVGAGKMAQLVLQGFAR